MGILDTLQKEKWGLWKSHDELFAALRRRDAGAITALGSVLGLEPAEQKELGQGRDAPEVLGALVADLRVQKSARLAAARCCLEAGLEPQRLADLFLCGADLLTDPRLGGKARQLAEQGLVAALAHRVDIKVAGQPAGDFARGVHAASSVLGAGRAKELLAAAPLGHSGATAARFALGEELQPGEKESWDKLLAEQCAANRKAPAAAKRLGLAPPWPPFLPDAFAPLIKAAEEKASGVTTTDALVRAAGSPAAAAEAGAANPSPSPEPGPPGSRTAPPLPASGTPPPRPLPLPRPAAQYSSQYLGTKKIEAPIQRRTRAPTGQIEEKPDVRESRTMPAVIGRPAPLPGSIVPEMTAAALAAGSARTTDAQALASTEKLAEKLPPSVLAALAMERGLYLPDGRYYKSDDPLRFDPLGRRVPRSDRWEDLGFEWPDPVLPASTLKPTIRATMAQGPFAARLKSIFDNRPEAVERLCAAAEARALIAGEELLLTELTREMAHPRWAKKRVPEGQLARLRAIADDGERPSAWRRAAETLLTSASRPSEPGAPS